MAYELDGKMKKLTTHGVALIDLSGCQCHFAVRHDTSVPGGYLFCGEPTLPDRAYCAYHNGIVFVAQKGRAENMHRVRAA